MDAALDRSLPHASSRPKPAAPYLKPNLQGYRSDMYAMGEIVRGIYAGRNIRSGEVDRLVKRIEHLMKTYPFPRSVSCCASSWCWGGTAAGHRPPWIPYFSPYLVVGVWVNGPGSMPALNAHSLAFAFAFHCSDQPVLWRGRREVPMQHLKGIILNSPDPSGQQVRKTSRRQEARAAVMAERASTQLAARQAALEASGLKRKYYTDEFTDPYVYYDDGARSVGRGSLSGGRISGSGSEKPREQQQQKRQQEDIFRQVSRDWMAPAGTAC